MNVDTIERSLVDHRTKGIPGGTAPFALGEIGQRCWNVLRGDLPLPLAVLRESALEHNSQWMRHFLARSGAVIAPHGKTTASPQLFKRQLDDGAWAITVATLQQLQVCREHGIQRIVFANQLVGRPEIRYVLDELHRDPAFDFHCLVDSIDGVRMLCEAAREHPLQRPVQLLVEGGYASGRAGCRSLPQALEVARAVKEAEPHLALRGVEGFEGLISGDSSEEVDVQVAAFLDFLIEIAARCDEEGLFSPGPVLLSAGGSAFYDMVTDRFCQASLNGRLQVVVRSGCYLTHDSRMYKDAFREMLARSPELRSIGEGLRPALEVWAYVQSRPEPELAITTMGKRDCGFDAGFPVPLAWFRPGQHTRPEPLSAGYEITNMNDQHTFLRLPAESDLAVGDMVVSGISHPCTTFDKWQVLPVVNDHYDVTSAIRTFF